MDWHETSIVLFKMTSEEYWRTKEDNVRSPIRDIGLLVIVLLCEKTDDLVCFFFFFFIQWKYFSL